MYNSFMQDINILKKLSHINYYFFMLKYAIVSLYKLAICGMLGMDLNGGLW